MTLADGRVLTRRLAYNESLRWDPNDGDTFFNLAVDLKDGEQFVLWDGRSMNKFGLFVEALFCDPKNVKFQTVMKRYAPSTFMWTRRLNSNVFGQKTNVLFATLLLGVQRLEEAGTLPLTHYTMLENMLELWTWGLRMELEGKP